MMLQIIDALFQTDLVIFGAVFVSYAITDALYAWYTLKVTERKAFAAASIGSFMHILIAFGVINYSKNWIYIIPMVCGSWIGTYVLLTLKNTN